jgi:flagellar basal body-associated protein FliL
MAKPPPKDAKKGPAPAKAAPAAAAPAEDMDEEAKPAGKGALLLAAGFAGAVLVGVAIGVGLHFLGVLGATADSTAKPEAKQSAVLEITPPVLVEMPEKLVDLKTGTCQAPYLRFQISVDVPQKAQPLVAARQVEILDAVQQYLRGRERQDLVGREGADRLRNETRRRINELIAPEQINGVLFKKFVLQ